MKVALLLVFTFADAEATTDAALVGFVDEASAGGTGKSTDTFARLGPFPPDRSIGGAPKVKMLLVAVTVASEEALVGFTGNALGRPPAAAETLDSPPPDRSISGTEVRQELKYFQPVWPSCMWGILTGIFP